MWLRMRDAPVVAIVRVRIKAAFDSAASASREQFTNHVLASASSTRYWRPAFQVALHSMQKNGWGRNFCSNQKQRLCCRTELNQMRKKSPRGKKVLQEQWVSDVKDEIGVTNYIQTKAELSCAMAVMEKLGGWHEEGERIEVDEVHEGSRIGRILAACIWIKKL